MQVPLKAIPEHIIVEFEDAGTEQPGAERDLQVPGWFVNEVSAQTPLEQVKKAVAEDELEEEEEEEEEGEEK